MRRLALLSLLCWCVSLAAPAAWAHPYHRSVGDIAWAIGLDHAWIPEAKRIEYARVLKLVSREHQFDALTAVALIWHESKWDAAAIGDGGLAIGLAQIHYRALCGSPEACKHVRLRLLDGRENLRQLARLVTIKRDYCRRVTGRPAKLVRWLHAYGYRQRRNLKCNMTRTANGWKDRPTPRKIRRIVDYRQKLIRALRRRRA